MRIKTTDPKFELGLVCGWVEKCYFLSCRSSMHCFGAGFGEGKTANQSIVDNAPLLME